MPNESDNEYILAFFRVLEKMAQNSLFKMALICFGKIEFVYQSISTISALGWSECFFFWTLFSKDSVNVLDLNAFYRIHSNAQHPVDILFCIPFYERDITKCERSSCRRSHFPVKSCWTINFSVLCIQFGVVRTHLIDFPCTFTQFNA